MKPLYLPLKGTEVFDYHAFATSPRRQRSREVDFGCWWRMDWQDQRITYRISWIEDTGELYAVPLMLSPSLVYILGHFPTRKDVETALEGWAEPGARIGPFFLPQ